MSALNVAARNGRETGEKQTVADLVLLAATTFSGEFSKWQLAVMCWQIAPDRFGMRGYEKQHPDMNRVMMEIVGKKHSSPVGRGFMVRVRENVYRTTPAGRAYAAMIGDRKRADELYAALASYLDDPAYRRWLDNPEEPRLISEALSFLGCQLKQARESGRAQVRHLIVTAREWMQGHGIETIPQSVPRGCVRPPRAFGWTDLASLDDFLTALEYRFPALVGKH